MVPAIAEWLQQTRKETQQGRAQLLLAELTEAWTRKSRKRYLPSLGETIYIWRFSGSRKWTDSNWRLMRLATRMHMGRLAASAAVFALVTLALYWGSTRLHQQEARRLVEDYCTAPPERFQDLVARMQRLDDSDIESEIGRRREGEATALTRLRLAALLPHINSSSQADEQLLAGPRKCSPGN